MPCTLETPCAGQVHVVLVTPWVTLRECVGSGHTFREEHRERPMSLTDWRFRHVGRAADGGVVFEDQPKHPPVNCRWCKIRMNAQSDPTVRCVRHTKQPTHRQLYSKAARDGTAGPPKACSHCAKRRKHYGPKSACSLHGGPKRVRRSRNAQQQEERKSWRKEIRRASTTTASTSR